MSCESIGVNETFFESTGLGSLLIPDFISPAQHADRCRTNGRSPEQMLFLAVLEDGIDCWLRGGIGATSRITIRRATEAEDWIWQGGGMITFAACCEVMGILPAWLQRKLESIRDRRPIKLSRIRPQYRVMPGEVRELPNNIAIAAGIIKRSQEKSREIINPRIERICPSARMAERDGAGDSNRQGTLPGFGSGSEAAVRRKSSVEGYAAHVCRAAGEDG